MAVEDYIAEATTEINAAKPINKNSNGEVIELSDAEYDAKITALATQKDYDANQSYKDKELLNIHQYQTSLMTFTIME